MPCLEHLADATGVTFYLADENGKMIGEIGPIPVDGRRALARTNHALGRGVNNLSDYPPILYSI